MARVITSTAPQKPPKAGKMARQPKLTTKSGMPSGTTTRMAQRCRPGRSVRSTNQASTVPSTAHSAVTTKVRLTVFHSSWAVRLRNSSGCSVDQPVWKAWTIRKTSGVTTARPTTTAVAKRSGGPVRWCPGRWWWERW